MKVTSQHQIIKVIQDIANTKSPKLKFDLISNFINNIPEEFSDINEEYKKNIINEYRDQRDKASAIGKKYSELIGKKVKIFDAPGFFINIKAKVLCACCGQNLQGNPGFIWKQSIQIWVHYCPTPECFPKNHSNTMINNYKYKKWLANAEKEIKIPSLI